MDFMVNFGIGFKIQKIGKKKVEKIDDLDSAFYEMPDFQDNFEWFVTGDYDSKSNSAGYFICIKAPFENGIEGLQEKIKKLESFLLENKIQTEGKLNLVGGLLIG